MSSVCVDCAETLADHDALEEHWRAEHHGPDAAQARALARALEAVPQHVVVQRRRPRIVKRRR